MNNFIYDHNRNSTTQHNETIQTQRNSMRDWTSQREIKNLESMQHSIWDNNNSNNTIN